MYTRREFLAQSASIAAGCLAPHLNPPQSPPPNQTLRQAGAACGILTGCAVATGPLRNDAVYASLIRTQAGIIVAENAMKFGPLRPSPTEFHFEDADLLATFAAQNNIKLRGHNFVWHNQLPSWFSTFVTPQNAEHVLVDHIERVGGRYAGRIHSWDVANEVILPSDNLPHSLRNTPWLKLLPNHLEIAFRTARRVDPKALLVYNDYGIESENPEAATKRAAVLALLRNLQSRNVPIDALGIQSHIHAGPSHHYGPGLTSLIAEARAMGLKVLITELDVDDREAPGDIPQRDVAIAETYSGYLKSALADPAVIALLTWGITDKYTWIKGDSRPLPLDANLQPKPAFDAMLQSLRNAPKRH